MKALWPALVWFLLLVPAHVWSQESAARRHERVVEHLKRTAAEISARSLSGPASMGINMGTPRGRRKCPAGGGMRRPAGPAPGGLISTRPGRADYRVLSLTGG